MYTSRNMLALHIAIATNKDRDPGLVKPKKDTRGVTGTILLTMLALLFIAAAYGNN